MFKPLLYKELGGLEERESLPLLGPSNYRVNNRIIYTKVLEINATLHCNLSCENCSHSAPQLRNYEYNLHQLTADLYSLKNFIRCDVVRIVGGEPLLHKNIKGLIKVIRESGISKEICLITNGTLLPYIDTSIFDELDSLEVSLYPLNNQIREIIMTSIKKIKSYCVTKVLDYHSFRIPFVKQESDNNSLVQTIYRTCQIAHYWRCLTIEDGFLFRCPQSMINAKRTSIYSDGLKLESINNFREVLDFLENNKPLSFCYRCLGSVGKLVEHKQVDRMNWNSHIPNDIESSIDYMYMKEILSNYHSDWKCMKRRNI